MASRRRSDDAVSDTESVEFKDAIHDEAFSRHFFDGDASTIDISNSVGRITKGWSDKDLQKRIAARDLEELRVFIGQKLFKLDGILCSEEVRLCLIQQLSEIDLNEDVNLDAKYGRELASWLRDRLAPAVTDCSSILKLAAKEFNVLRQVDPLCTWFNQSPEVSTHVVERVCRFAGAMASRVRWSLLVEPGKLSCHLTNFVGEFHRLERMSQVELSHDELAQTAFNANFLTKARSQAIPCLDATRVKLQNVDSPLAGLEADFDHELFSDARDFDGDRSTGYGTSDFIHASYIRGGPLLNTFILSQMPLKNTINDFWKMVYQENTGIIVMLCSAADLSKLKPLERSKKTQICPYYWPRVEGESCQYGNIWVRNIRVDCAADPVFNITHLEVHVDGGKTFMVEHWHMDWQYMGDIYWPFRVLRRARLSKTPTIVQCTDGCSRSGTLVAIETALMHLLRGCSMEEDIVLLSALFVRLQRRFAIGSSLHYLFIYRCVLHWIAPFVKPFFQKMSLGLSFSQFGFIDKYNEAVLQQNNIQPPY